MNPDDFSWSADQQVTVKNPTDEDYKFMVHGKSYMVGAGKSAKMPGYIAWNYTYGMAVKLVQADNEFARWNEEGFRQEYYDKIFVEADEIIQAVQPAQADEEQEAQTFDEPPKPAPGTGMNYTSAHEKQKQAAKK